MVRIAMIVLLCLATVAHGQTPAERIVPRDFPVPEVTEWRPSGCRAVSFEHPALLPRIDPDNLPPAVDGEDDGCAIRPARESAWPLALALVAFAAIAKRRDVSR